MCHMFCVSTVLFHVFTGLLLLLFYTPDHHNAPWITLVKVCYTKYMLPCLGAIKCTIVKGKLTKWLKTKNPINIKSVFIYGVFKDDQTYGNSFLLYFVRRGRSITTLKLTGEAPSSIIYSWKGINISHSSSGVKNQQLWTVFTPESTTPRGKGINVISTCRFELCNVFRMCDMGEPSLWNLRNVTYMLDVRIDRKSVV